MFFEVSIIRRILMGGCNGYFQLEIKQDGTYIKLFEAEEGGQPILYDDINKYFMDIRLY